MTSNAQLRLRQDPLETATDAQFNFRDKLVAIVFVNQRIIATSLAALIRKFASEKAEKYGHLRVGFAVGGKSAEAYKNAGAKKIEEMDQERKKLQTTLNEFKRGDINCIIATQVLEEGLDIQNCNL